MPDSTLQTPRSDRVSVREKIAWALGSLGDNYASQLLTQLATPVYNVALGVPAELLAKALSIPRVIDSFADPTVGYLSDNSRSRWGRRRPFILAGAIPLALLSFALWLPGEAWSHRKIAAFLGIVTLFYYLAYALFIVPYRALGFELTSDYNERTRVQGWGMMFGLIGGLGIPWLYRLALAFGEAGAGPSQSLATIAAHGAKWAGLCVAGVILVACSAPAFLCRERISADSQRRIAILDALRETAKNRPFMIMLLARTFALVTIFAITTINTPLLIYLLFGGDQAQGSSLQGFAGNAQFIGAAIGLPFITASSARFGKRHGYVISLVLASAGYLSQWFTLRAGHPYWLLASTFAIGFGTQGIWLMCQSMVADVCDEDELRTGRRREGIYGATYALLEKLGVTGGVYFAGTVATLCGYQAGVPSAEMLEKMRLATIFVPILGLAASAVVIWRYPLTHRRMIEIREQLDARKTDSVSR